MNQEDINEILSIKTREGKTVKEMTTKEFCKYFLSKLSGIPAYDKEVMSLTSLLQNWRQETMNEESKVSIVLRVRRLGLI
jgi:hypothetical protein